MVERMLALNVLETAGKNLKIYLQPIQSYAFLFRATPTVNNLTQIPTQTHFPLLSLSLRQFLSVLTACCLPVVTCI